MPAFNEIGQAVEEVSDMSAAPSGLIRINSDATAAEQVLIPLVAKFVDLHPEMRVEIVTDGRLVDIAEGSFDCGVRLADLVPEDMVAVPIGPEQQHIVVASPIYLEKAPRLEQPSDLSLHRCVQLRMASGAVYRWEFQRRGEQFTVATRGHILVDHSRLLLEAAKQNYGLAYVTKGMAEPSLRSGELRQVLSDWTPPYPGLCLYYPRQRHMSAGMRAFASMLRARP